MIRELAKVDVDQTRLGSGKKMVTRDKVMPRLLAACPSFQDTWAQYVDDPTYAGQAPGVQLRPSAAVSHNV